jgi:outer membrane protein
LGLTGSANRVHQETETGLAAQSPNFSSALSTLQRISSGASVASVVGGQVLTRLTQPDSVKTDTTYNTHDLALTLTQPIFRRENWIQLSQADNRIAQAQAEYLAEEQGLMLRVSDAYFNVLGAEDALEFARAERIAIERQLEQAKQRFEVGLIAITGVHEAQARFDQARASEIAAQNALDNAWEALREITGYGEEQGSLDSVAADLPLDMPVPADIEAWSEVAVEQNPAVIAALNGTEIARKNIEVQRSEHYPKIDLVGSHSISRTDRPTGTDVDASSIGVQLAVPLYAGGGIVSRTREARHAFDAAKDQLEQQRRSAKRQVRDSYRGVESNISRVEALAAANVSAESALEATEAGYEVGTRTIVDVLNAEQELFRAKREYARARYDYIVNGLALKQAAGSLSPEDLRRVNGLLAEKSQEQEIQE